MRKKPIISLALLIFLLGNAPHAGAFFLDELLDKISKPLTTQKEESFTLNSSIEQIDDVNKNNILDGGDYVRFIYKINNPTDKEYSFTSLKTNIDKSTIHFVRNIHGTMSLSDENKTITIPNIRILPGETRIISFDATINYIVDLDTYITSDAELTSFDKKQLLKSDKKSLQIKGLKEKKNGMTGGKRK